jgi:cell division protein FtsL
MKCTLVSLLFLALMASLAFPLALLVTVPLTIVTVSNARKQARQARAEAEYFAHNELCLQIAKAVR